MRFNTLAICTIFLIIIGAWTRIGWSAPDWATVTVSPQVASPGQVITITITCGWSSYTGCGSNSWSFAAWECSSVPGEHTTYVPGSVTCDLSPLSGSCSADDAGAYASGTYPLNTSDVASMSWQRRINDVLPQGMTAINFCGEINWEDATYYGCAVLTVPGSVTVPIQQGGGMHELQVTAQAEPSTVSSGGNSNLSATATDSLGHGIASWQWDDGGAGGSFDPSAEVQTPIYTAPVNASQDNLTVNLTVTATCDGPLPISGSGTTELIIRPRGVFSDVPKWHWAWRYIQGVSNAGIASGYPEGDYKPSLTVSRDQMAVFISRAVTGGDEYVPTGPATATFSDVPNTGYGPDGTEPYWAYKYIEFCASPEANIVRGYDDGSYHPTEVVNRGQMAVFIARSMVVPSGDAAINDPIPPPTFPDVTGDNEWAWCYKHVEFIAEAGVTQGYPDGNYQPGNQVSRDQMAVYICRAFDLPMPPQPYNVTDYFPLNQGDTWTYESDNGPYSSTISGTESISGQTCARMVSTYGGTNYWSTSEDGLRYGGWSSSGEGYNTYNPLLYIPNGIDPGYTDSQSLPAYHNGSLVGTANFTLTFIGVETVTVPAGTFLNCIKFEVLAQDAEGFTEHFHVWWAKDVGQVKQDQRPFGGSRWEELTSATVGGINYNGQSYNATDYFPMGQGDTWTYNTATGSETETISGTRIIGGETYVSAVNTSGYTHYMRAGSEGVYFGGIETTDGLYTLVPPLLVPNGIIIGQTVNQSGSLYLDGVFQETGSFNLEFVRLENVTVPAGTFSDCLVLYWSQTYSALGDDVFLWVAKNVGIVKQDESPGWWSQLTSATVGGVSYP